MAQIILIKNVNTDEKHLDDYLGAFESNHVFSDLDKEEYTILQIEGIERKELAEFFEGKRPKSKRVYRTTVANQWTETVEKKDAWQDGTDWKLLEKTPKYQFNFSAITKEEREDLADKGLNKTVKFLILGKAVDRISLEETNDTVISISAIREQ
ncbi:MAG: hypothetical protein GY853_15330 [PVC group bacterium]|nr:hypothetical protein [PVC group bacterium]